MPQENENKIETIDTTDLPFVENEIVNEGAWEERDVLSYLPQDGMDEDIRTPQQEAWDALLGELVSMRQRLADLERRLSRLEGDKKQD